MASRFSAGDLSLKLIEIHILFSPLRYLLRVAKCLQYLVLVLLPELSLGQCSCRGSTYTMAYAGCDMKTVPKSMNFFCLPCHLHSSWNYWSRGRHGLHTVVNGDSGSNSKGFLIAGWVKVSISQAQAKKIQTNPRYSCQLLRIYAERASWIVCTL